jgi:hypothetical protein
VRHAYTAARQSFIDYNTECVDVFSFATTPISMVQTCVGSSGALRQHTFIVTLHGIDTVDLLETDSAFAGTVLNYRVPPSLRVSNGTLTDCAALAASGWGSALRWVIPSPPSSSAWCCNATGITCGGPDGRVTEIRLARKRLMGMYARAIAAHVHGCFMRIASGIQPAAHANARLLVRISTRVSIVVSRCPRNHVLLGGDVSLGPGRVGLGWVGF